jgi:UV DNA damage endonuclease|tara:strand:+ start:410 stop:1321 length:912 start_codon:yes stop_codon:yes gene_type:complete
MTNLGYACINMTLRKDKITTNRSMIKRTFLKEGITRSSDLALQNTRDLIEIIKWNHKNGFKLFRMTSDLIPWASEFSLSSMPDYRKISILLNGAGNLAAKYGQRITSHPGPFNVLVSPNERVVNNTIRDLSIHGEIFDLMGLSRTPYNKINIHCNGVYGDKQSAMDRFCKNFERLPESVQTRLTVENDDKASMYSVKDLMYIHERIGIPIVFDYHHHKFCTGDMTEQEALELAMSTWGDIKPVVHYSESRTLEDETAKPQAHSDYIYSKIDTYGHDLDIVVEAKAKELTVLNYLSNFSKHKRA